MESDFVGQIVLPTIGGLALLLIGVEVLRHRAPARNPGRVGGGLALVSAGLLAMVLGLRPVRALPVVDAVVAGLGATTLGGAVISALIAAGFTLLVRSAVATLGLVTSLGGADVVDVSTALALAVGAGLVAAAGAALAAAVRDRPAPEGAGPLTDRRVSVGVRSGDHPR